MGTDVAGCTTQVRSIANNLGQLTSCDVFVRTEGVIGVASKDRASGKAAHIRVEGVTPRYVCELNRACRWTRGGDHDRDGDRDGDRSSDGELGV